MPTHAKILRLAAVAGFLPLIASPVYAAAKPKVHSVGLGAVKRVPYSAEGDPAGNTGDEKELRVRPLIVDGKVKEWTTGDSHDVTDRSFTVRRALRLNDALPTEKAEHWIWQRGPWLLIDRATGHVAALRLPDFDPGVSYVEWFRDFAAYCGVPSGGKQLYAVVAQVAARKPLLHRKLAGWNPQERHAPACGPAAWQREPLRVTFSPNGSAAVSYDLVGLSAMLVEDGDASDGNE